LTCAIYRLADLGEDPSLGQWIADTIPGVIEPGTWSENGGLLPGKVTRLSYHPPTKTLVIYHTPAVQAKVAVFLQELKQALPPEQARATGKASKPLPRDAAVVPAGYTTPNALKTADPATLAKSPYLVPPPAQQPKHLFHLIIRYEGDGLVDANVTGLLEQLSGQKWGKEESKTDAKPASTAPLSQLFNFIIRYEGEGLVDANIVELAKIYAAQNQAPVAGKGPCCLSVPVLSGAGGRWNVSPASGRPAPDSSGTNSGAATPALPAAPLPKPAGPPVPTSSSASGPSSGTTTLPPPRPASAY
jgi:hypothetical protein